MDYNKDKDKKSHKPIYIFAIVMIVLLSLFSLTFTHPVMLLAPFWDGDIENQLLRANENAIDTANKMGVNPEEVMVYYRLIYDNNADTEIRIERAINTFEELFNHTDNFHEIKYEENNTLLELTWHYQKQN